MTKAHVDYGPRLIASATGHLTAALVAAPTPAIESAAPLQAEPSAVYERARTEHEVFVKTLKFFGVEVTLIEPPLDHALACAVGDLAVVLEHGAVIMRPSSFARRDEPAWIEDEFSKLDVPIGAHIDAPSLLDGNDVLLVADVAFIGITSRSNALGRGAFAAIARANGLRVVEVAVPGRIASLRSVVTAVAKDTVAVAAQGVDPAVFEALDLRVITIPADGALGAGPLCVGEHHVLADVRFPRAIDALRAEGITVDAIDLYDFARVGLAPAALAIAVKRL
ncbi:MAG: hypothetical protein M3Y18_07305 [Candidatus Eremiobacteraeota bacterium]|nr:hypothetical protein [Candidatus Eremiobacteraeota bacterium]